MTVANILKKIHLFGIYKRTAMFLVNRVFVGRKSFSCKVKRFLLRSIGHSIGKGTTIISPVFITGTCSIGEKCWINRGFSVYGNGRVIIGNNCDIAPDVVFLTGGHRIGDSCRRAGDGESYTTVVENGCWIGARSTLFGNVIVHEGSIVAACSFVNKDGPYNSMVGGIPAKHIKNLD